MKNLMKRFVILFAVWATSSLLGNSVFAEIKLEFGPVCYGQAFGLSGYDFYDASEKPVATPVVIAFDESFYFNPSTQRYEYQIYNRYFDASGTMYDINIYWYPKPTTQITDTVICNGGAGNFTWRDLTIDGTRNGQYTVDEHHGTTSCVKTTYILNVRNLVTKTLPDTTLFDCCDEAEHCDPDYWKVPYTWYYADGESQTTEFDQGNTRDSTYEHYIKSQVCTTCDSIKRTVHVTRIVTNPLEHRYYWICYDEPDFVFYADGNHYSPEESTNSTPGEYYPVVTNYTYGGISCRDTVFYLHIFRHDEPVTNHKDTTMCKDGPGFRWKPNEDAPYFEDIEGNEVVTHEYTIPTEDGLCDSLVYSLATHVLAKRSDTIEIYDTICMQTFEYKWPDGETQEITFDEDKLDYEYLHTMKSKVCSCDSVECKLKVHYAPGATRDPNQTHLYVCKDSTSVYFPPMQKSYTAEGSTNGTPGEYYPEYIFADGRRGGEEEKNEWGVCADSMFYLIVHKKEDDIIDSIYTVNVCDNAYPDGYDWHGRHITQAGIHYDTLKSAYCNCDTIRWQVTFTFNKASDSVYTVYACHNEHYLWSVNGETYTFATYGSYVTVTETIPNSVGCDSICRLELTFLPDVEYADKDTFFCDGSVLDFFGTMIDYEIPASGRETVPVKSTLNPNCDSIIYYLAVERHYPTSADPIYDTICHDNLPYVWHGEEYNETGQYFKTLTNAAGCDSACTLRLFVTPEPQIIKIDSLVCVGKSFNWRDKIIDFIDEPFTYEKHYQFTQFGKNIQCDSVIFMLTADTVDCCTHLTNIKLSKPVFCGNAQSYDMSLVYATGLPANYTLTFSSKAQQQGFIDDVLHAHTYESDSESERYANYALIKVPFTPVTDPTSDYLHPDAYPLEIVVTDSCERPFTYQLRDTIFVYYPSWITEQYLTSTIALLNNRYNYNSYNKNGYKFSSIQWYANGEPIGGATQSYLSVHTQPKDSVAYQAYLVRSDDKYGTFTCPVYLTEYQQQTPVTEGFVTVIPTLLDKTNSTLYITSNKRGTYTIYDMMGRLVERENFSNCESGCPINITKTPQNMLMMIVELDDGYSETFFLLVQ